MFKNWYFSLGFLILVKIPYSLLIHIVSTSEHYNHQRGFSIIQILNISFIRLPRYKLYNKGVYFLQFTNCFHSVILQCFLSIFSKVFG